MRQQWIDGLKWLLLVSLSASIAASFVPSLAGNAPIGTIGAVEIIADETVAASKAKAEGAPTVIVLRLFDTEVRIRAAALLAALFVLWCLMDAHERLGRYLDRMPLANGLRAKLTQGVLSLLLSLWLLMPALPYAFQVVRLQVALLA